jgi:hypothetical protein
MFRSFLKFALLFQIFATSLYAESCWHKLFCGGIQSAAIGPVWYWQVRERFLPTPVDESTLVSKINGNMWGVHLEYDRIRKGSLYWAVEGQWAQTELNGKTRSGLRLNALSTDWFVEGRIGWTMNVKMYASPSLTLYTGFGHYDEILNFGLPSPAEIHSNLFFNYVPFGLLARAWLTYGFWIGVRATVMVPLSDPTDQIKFDPLFGNYTIHAGSKLQFRVELPIQWNFSCCLGLRVTPFYWNVRYGAKEDFPANFIETKTTQAGVRLELTAQW